VAEHVQLGRLLVERGLVAPDQLEIALDEQIRSNRSLGRVLIEMGLVREDDLVATLAHQVGLDFVDLSATRIDPAAVARVPEALARRHHVVAIGWRDERLLVAVADPSNVVAIDDVRAATGLELVPVVATRAAIDAVLDAVAAGALPADPPPAAVPVRTRPMGQLLVAEARQSRASEIYIEAQPDGARIRYRVDGVLHEITSLSPDALAALRPSLAELTSTTAELRLLTLPTLHGDTLIVRLLAPGGTSIALDSLGLGPDIVERLRATVGGRHGAVLVTGPSGSGVTTALHALLAEAVGADRHVVAVEDPVEGELPGVTQVIVGPDLPVVTTVRRALVARPDVLLLGDVRDGATAAVALDAALSGVFVLAGLAGREAVAAPGRLLAMGLEPVLVAGAMRAVVSPRLVRRLCPACKQPWAPSDAELDSVGWDDDLEQLPELYRARGCEECGGIGYIGVTAIAEVLTMTDDVARLVAMRASASDLHKLAIAQGMRPLRQAGLALAREGITSLTEITRVL
jgi:type IV pilus assembly protein PilB